MLLRAVHDGSPRRYIHNPTQREVLGLVPADWVLIVNGSAGSVGHRLSWVASALNGDYVPTVLLTGGSPSKNQGT